MVGGGRLNDIESFDFERESKNLKISQSVSDMYPANTLGVPVFSSTSVEEEEFASIKSGRVVLYIIGKVTYADVFEREHTSWVCVHYDPSTNSFPNCKKYTKPD